MYVEIHHRAIATININIMYVEIHHSAIAMISINIMYVEIYHFEYPIATYNKHQHGW